MALLGSRTVKSPISGDRAFVEKNKFFNIKNNARENMD